MPKIIVIGHQL